MVRASFLPAARMRQVHQALPVVSCLRAATGRPQAVRATEVWLPPAPLRGRGPGGAGTV